ncbi:hypothetical protein FDZ74_13350 [bacterium]|nr:MAG: hypothetical protein FDZ74_13350 [bacterium]
MLTPESAERVKQYFDAGSHFAGATFDTLGANPADAFCPDDLLAVHLLGMDFDPLAVRMLLEQERFRSDIQAMLERVPTSVRLWDDEADTLLPICESLWALLKDLPGVGWVTAGKLLARKRPQLVPILDQVVWDYFQPPKGEFWSLMQASLRSSDLPAQIELALRPAGAGDRSSSVSTLRLLDVAVWMDGMSRRGAQQ